MPKIIIEHDDDIPFPLAAKYVAATMQQERVSASVSITTFMDNIEVIARDRRTLNSADSFLVRRAAMAEKCHRYFIEESDSKKEWRVWVEKPPLNWPPGHKYHGVWAKSHQAYWAESEEECKQWVDENSQVCQESIIASEKCAGCSNYQDYHPKIEIP